MNRRSFLGSVLAAPIAAVMGWKSKGPIGWWGRETFKRHRGPTITTDEFARAVGESHKRLKTEAAAKTFSKAWDYESILDMPKTKEVIDYQWQKYEIALKSWK